MRTKGAKHIHYLPLATDPDRFIQTEKLPIDKEVVFVGDSMTKAIAKVKKVLDDRETYLAMMISVDLVNGKRFDEILENIGQLPQKNIWSILQLAVWEATATKRLDVLLSLVNKYDVHIYGDPYWKQLVPGATYRGSVNYGKDLSKIFATSEIVVSTTNYQMPTAVNQRIFDVPMSGGLCISDNQSDMYDLFDDVERVLYSSLGELKDKIDTYLGDRDSRERVIEASRERVLRDHTYQNRLSAMISIMVSRRGSC
jgi:spore maturation protein CgeB